MNCPVIVCSMNSVLIFLFEVGIADEWMPENTQDDLSSSSSCSEDNQSSNSDSNDSGNGEEIKSLVQSCVIPKAKVCISYVHFLHDYITLLEY